MVVAGSEDAKVVGGSDGGAVGGGDVADSGAVAGESGLLDIVAGGGTSEETILADNSVNVGSGTLQEVEEGTAVESSLLEVQVDLGARVLVGGQEGEDSLSLETLSNRVGQLNLGLQGVGSVPCLGKGKAWTAE